MKLLITVVFSIVGSSIFAQTTAIPDANFEQALINLGLDSDNTINGQVATADIAGVETLDLSADSGNSPGDIADLTGIEDFASLNVLNVSNIGLYGTDLETNTLDLSPLTNLEELYMNSGGDAITLHVEHVDLSNNPNLNMIIASDVLSLMSIDLRGSDLELTDLYLHATNYIMPGEGGVCVTVSNPSDAENGLGVYATWDLCCGLSFSADCNLGTSTFDKSDIRLSPNPATALFQIDSPSIKAVKIYNLQGELVKHFSEPRERYSVVNLERGVYVVEIRSVHDQKQVVKLVKW